jgi:glycosyltransferase involved in cell wall biosynthesis
MAASDIRVLRIIAGLDPRFGGPSESSVTACIAAQRAGTRNTFVFPEATSSRAAADDACDRLVDAGVDVRRFSIVPRDSRYAQRWGVSPALAGWIARAVRRHDIVHVHQTWGLVQIVGLLAGVCTRRPCVVSPHESLTDYDVGHTRPGSKALLRRLYLANASLIVLSSPLEAMDSIPAGHRVRGVVIPHPLAEIAPPAGGRPRRAGAPLVVGFLGRLHHKKNVDVLIRALARASGTARLVIAGDGPDETRRELADLAAEVGAADRVRWLGFVPRDRREAFFESIDVLAMPSKYECFGMAAAEAIGRGIATVVSPTTGIADLVSRYGCGRVALPTPDGLAEALRELEADPQLVMELGIRAGVAARSELSADAYGDRIQLEYERLVGRRSPADLRREMPEWGGPACS